MTLKFIEAHDDIYDRPVHFARCVHPAPKYNRPQVTALLIMPRGKKLDVILRYRERFEDLDTESRVIRRFWQTRNEPLVFFPKTAGGMKRAHALCNFIEKYGENHEVLASLRQLNFYHKDTKWKELPLVILYKLDCMPYLPGKKAGRRSFENYMISSHDTPGQVKRHVVNAALSDGFAPLPETTFDSLDEAQNFCRQHYLEGYASQIEKSVQREQTGR